MALTRNPLFKTLTLSVCTIMLMTSCSSINPFGETEDPPLPGERVSVLELDSELEANSLSREAQPFIAPSVWENSFWPQKGGYPNHAMQNPAFTDGMFNEVWSVSIGSGGSRNQPLTSQPIVVGELVYTMDAKQNVRAFNINNGKNVWEASLKPPQEDEVAVGGGLSFGEGFVFVTNGFSEIAALDPNTGKLAWRKTLPAPARSAPTILEKVLYVQTSDNQLVALETGSGQELWRYSGFQSESGLIGSSSPAVSKDMIVVGFSSGEFTGLDPKTGAVLWSDTLAPRRRIGGVSSISDVIALPVLDRELAIGIGYGKRMTAINTQNGARVWQKEIGGLETPWVSGNSIFVVTNENKLVSLVRETGTINWVYDLKSINKSDGEYWTGPLYAGNRLILASSEGQITEVNPQNGQPIRTSRAEGDVKIAPVIAGKTLYILSDNGKLTAYR